MSDGVQLHKPTLLFCVHLLDMMRARTEASTKLTHLRREAMAGAFDAAATELDNLAAGDVAAEVEAQDRAALAHIETSLSAQREVARAKGYTGDCCSGCGSLTMVRNGTCLKCETCGETTGCS